MVVAVSKVRVWSFLKCSGVYVTVPCFDFASQIYCMGPVVVYSFSLHWLSTHSHKQFICFIEVANVVVTVSLSLDYLFAMLVSSLGHLSLNSTFYLPICQSLRQTDRTRVLSVCLSVCLSAGSYLSQPIVLFISLSPSACVCMSVYQS